MSGVEDALLQAPSDHDWIAWRGNWSSRGYSSLEQINRDNVRSLTLAWSLSLGTGNNAISPLVHDGVMFVNNSGTIRALEAATGDLIWSYARPATTNLLPVSQPRGLALNGHRLYVPTLDNHLLALDAKTGQLVWDKALAPANYKGVMTSAPTIAGDKVMQGFAVCGEPGGCPIIAVDAHTGNEAWRFYTIARPGQPGGDSWNGAPLEARAAASIWAAGSYDSQLNLVYFGVSQTYKIGLLLQPTASSGASNDGLYTDSTIALDPDNGRLLWHFQHQSRDVWNMDWAFERTLATLAEESGVRKAILTIGKVGILDAIDAETGRFLWSHDLGFQNIVASIDPKTGKKYESNVLPEKNSPKFICPDTHGVRNWPATAFDPESGLLYVPITENCGTNYYNENGFLGGKVALRRPDSDGKFGQIAAIDVGAKRVVWRERRRPIASSAALVTAGGLLFSGWRDRWFEARNSRTGELLWKMRLNDTPNSFPLTYSSDGRQYVTVVTGGGSTMDTVLRRLTPEIQPSTHNTTVWTFSLPED
jgi:alcohol dehydrogenase (cytochrome c)